MSAVAQVAILGGSPCSRRSSLLATALSCSSKRQCLHLIAGGTLCKDAAKNRGTHLGASELNCVVTLDIAGRYLLKTGTYQLAT